MGRLGELPLPPAIEAISRLDGLERLSDKFLDTFGYSPENVSHWDPKQQFEETLARWSTLNRPMSSLVRYVYSSYTEIDGRIRTRLNEGAERELITTMSGTTSIATVISYLHNIAIRELAFLTPAYFVAETLASMLRIPMRFVPVIRDECRYRLPSDISVAPRSAVWLTFPIYGASCYPSQEEVARFIDNLPDDTIVIVDESLAFPDRNVLAAVTTMHRVLRIATPHKALCLNGEKVSLISLPCHLKNAVDAWSECFAGGIGTSGANALQFLADDAFDRAAGQMRKLVSDQRARLRRVIRDNPRISTDSATDGHFVLLYWPQLSASLGSDEAFIERVVYASGATFMPATRNRHPEQCGFAFRVNLLRLDDAGLGAIKRVADSIDAIA